MESGLVFEHVASGTEQFVLAKWNIVLSWIPGTE